MSDLKHRSVESLKAERERCRAYIGKLQGQINNQKERLKWIEKYIFDKTPKDPDPDPDTEQAAQLAYFYLNVVRCAGDQLVNHGYCCPWCGSVDPSEVCSSPRKQEEAQ